MSTAMDLGLGVLYAWRSYDAFTTNKHPARWVAAPCCAYVAFVSFARVLW